MAGNLDDLEFELNVGLDESLKNLREVNDNINGAKGLTADLSTQFEKLNTATLQLAQSGLLPKHNADLLLTGLGSIGRAVEAITGQFDRMGTRLDTAVAASSADIGAQWLQINKGVTNTTAEMRRFAEQARMAAAATQTIVIDTVSNRMQPVKQAPFEMVKLASAALAMKAITGVTRSVTSARVALQDISKTTTMSVTAMDRFRLAMYAPKVNPAFNILKTVIDSVSGSASKATEYLRKTADAVMSDLPGALGVAVTGLGKLVGSLDRSQLTASKWISKLQTMSSGLKIFGFVFGSSSRNASLFNTVIKFAQPLLEKFSTLIDRGNQYLKMLLETAREAGQVLTGTFTQTGTSADLYATAAWAATVPTRLLAREMEGGARVANVAKYAFALVTHPIHALTLAVKHGSAEFGELQARMPQLQNSVGIVRITMGAATATARQMDSAFRMVRIAATDAAVAFVSSSPRASAAILRVRDSLAELRTSVANTAPAFRAAIGRMAASVSAFSRVVSSSVSGSLSQFITNGLQAAQSIGSQFVGSVNRAAAASANYSRSLLTAVQGSQSIASASRFASAAMARMSVTASDSINKLTAMTAAAIAASPRLQALSQSVLGVVASISRIGAGQFAALGSAAASASAAMSKFTGVSFSRIAASAGSLGRTFGTMANGALKALPADVTRLAQAVGARLTADVTRAAAGVARYVQSWELGIRAHRALSITLYAASKALSAVTAVVGPVAKGIIGVASASYRALTGMKSMASTAVFLTTKLTGLNAVASATKSTVSGGFASIASKASFANLAITGLAAGAIAMGANFAMATEKNQSVFGVMVKDMEQGKAIVADLQGSKAVGLFDNEEVLNSGRLLFKAGVAAVDLSAKTDQLATIAAATSTELGDLTRIYQQGANRGAFQQDKINQLAERGIDIYHALEATTGQSGQALADMISGGKIGITEMDAALAHLTEGNGIYAGSLQTLGGTTSGMLSGIKNNLMQALGGIGAVGNEAFKPVLSAILLMSEGIKNSIGAVAPVVTQLFMAIKGAFTGIWSVVTATFTGIFGAASATFGGLLSVTMEWVTKFRWFFESIVPIVQFVGLSMTSIMVTAFNDIAYWITDTMPAYLTWFGENWMNVFMDIGSGTATIFTNLAANIGNAMTAIWAFIKSGGTADLELAWTPLLTGFQSTVAALPDIPDRAMTELEKSLQEQTQQIGTDLANSFDAMNIEAQAALTVAPPEMPAIDPSLGGGMTTGEGDGAAGKNNRTDFSVSGLERGSEAALKAIFSAQKDKVPSQALAEHKKTNTLLARIASRPEPQVLGAV